MNILLAINTAFVHPTSGAGRSTATLMEWLADAGHNCQVLCTARFDGQGPDDLSAYLANLSPSVTIRAKHELPPNLELPSLAPTPDWPVAEFVLNGVGVTMLCIERRNIRSQSVEEMLQMIVEFDALAADFKPDLVTTYGGGRAVQSFLQRACRREIPTLFQLHNFGYGERRVFDDVDHVLCCSEFLARFYKTQIGLRSTGIPTPISWSEAVSEESNKRFLTLVNPSPHKGVAVFARIAGMLFERRPDIPIQVVQSAERPELLAELLPFTIQDHPNFRIMAAVDRPAEIYRSTKALLVPSLFQEPFGRVAAEAMMNGIPPLVGNRGGLPETVGDCGRVLPIPNWMDQKTVRLPEDSELEDWLETIIALWDDEALYEKECNLALAEAERLYGEQMARDRLVGYVESLRTGSWLF